MNPSGNTTVKCKSEVVARGVLTSSYSEDSANAKSKIATQQNEPTLDIYLKNFSKF